MPYKDPEKRKQVARDAMRRRRGSPSSMDPNVPLEVPVKPLRVETSAVPSNPRGTPPVLFPVPVPMAQAMSIRVAPALLKAIQGIVQEVVTKIQEAQERRLSVIEETLAELQSVQKGLLAGLEARGIRGLRSGKSDEDSPFSKTRQAEGKMGR